jgi:hypothetical protein
MNQQEVEEEESNLVSKRQEKV